MVPDEAHEKGAKIGQKYGEQKDEKKEKKRRRFWLLNLIPGC